jgi:hypothetical protein
MRRRVGNIIQTFGDQRSFCDRWGRKSSTYGEGPVIHNVARIAAAAAAAVAAAAAERMFWLRLPAAGGLLSRT